jgi:hypothetical protein
MAEDDPKKPPVCPGEDQLVIGGAPDESGHVPYVRHTADHEIEAGVMRPVQEGEAIDENSFRLEHRSGPIYAVKPVSEGDRKGPAKVASDAFRSGWDNIFGKRQPVGQA